MAAVPSAIALPLQPGVRSSGFFARLFRDKPLGAAGGVILLLFVVVGLIAQWISPYGFNEIAPIERLKPPSLVALVRHRQPRPRRAVALHLRRATVGDHRLSARHCWPR